MVESILKYSEGPLKAAMPFLETVDAPVHRLNNGQIYKGLGSEKQEVCISDMVGKALYIRQLQPEQIKQEKQMSSCDKEYSFTTRCKAVYYSFANEHLLSPDKIKSRMVDALNNLKFNDYQGTANNIEISLTAASIDMEKIFQDETGKKYEGSQFPVLVAIEFLLSYKDDSCELCDIEDSEC